MLLIGPLVALTACVPAVPEAPTAMPQESASDLAKDLGTRALAGLAARSLRHAAAGDAPLDCGRRDGLLELRGVGVQADAASRSLPHHPSRAELSQGRDRRSALQPTRSVGQARMGPAIAPGTSWSARTPTALSRRCCAGSGPSSTFLPTWAPATATARRSARTASAWANCGMPRNGLLTNSRWSPRRGTAEHRTAARHRRSTARAMRGVSKRAEGARQDRTASLLLT